MRSAFAARILVGYGGQPSRVACQPKLAGSLASEGWTTDMFLETIYREVSKRK